MVRKPENGTRRASAPLDALEAVVIHGSAVVRTGPLLLRGAVFGWLALYLGYAALKGGMGSVGLPALVMPAVSALTLASASARLFARAREGRRDRAREAAPPAPSPPATDAQAAEARRPGTVPFGRRTG